MARRSSARLRDRSTTPKRVSLSHDAPTTTTRTPKTLPAKLSSLMESDEMMPGAFPQSVSPSLMMEVDEATRTPTHRTPIRPTAKEMHPQLHHQSTAKPLDEARHLGFSNMQHINVPQTEPAPRQNASSRLAAMQGTPTHRNLEQDVTSPSYEFTFRREHSLELSPDAKRLMYEKREEAAKIKAQMIADGEGIQSIDDILGRKKATPGGRYGDVHDKEFAKMGSIVNHPSAFRADPNRVKPTLTAASATKSLKRSQSKAELQSRAELDATPSSRPASRDVFKPAPSFKSSALPRTTSTHDLTASASPAKRVKRAVNEDVSATRPASKDGPSTPQTHTKQQPSYPDLSHLTTPTQSSLSRAASIKSTKTSKIPGPQFTPAKAAPPPPPPASTLKQPIRPSEHNTPLLHRSPSKPSFFSKPNVVKSEVEKTNGEKPKSMMDPHLARTPAKAGFLKKTVGFVDPAGNGTPHEKPAPLLSRSPVKASIPKTSETDSPQQQKTAPVPFLSRSPSKIPMTGANNPFSTTTASSDTPGKSTATKLLGRFNLLRQSPMKSILRSPQRLYSDDPSKIAAGTHMATPPKKTPSKTEVASVRKRVDFSSSTKNSDSSREETPLTPNVQPSTSIFDRNGGKSEARTVSMLPTVDYPSLERADRMLSPSPQKRRETAGPGDFTFRADEHGVVFQSPNAANVSGKKRANTIRFIESESLSMVPTGILTGSKKRKHDFEDRNAVVEGEVIGGGSDKENAEMDEGEEVEERPKKRVKASVPSPVKMNGAAVKKGDVVEKKRSTLGVKPKGSKNLPSAKTATKGAAGVAKKGAAASGGGAAAAGTTKTISRERLNALSQPKKRG